MEAELPQSEDRHRRMAEATFEGVVLSEGGVILDVNEQFTEMFGYSLPELIGKPVIELVHPKHREMVREHLLSGYSQPYECLAIRKDGTVLTVKVQGMSTMYRGRRVRVAAISDYTECRAAEERWARLQGLLTAMNHVKRLIMWGEDMQAIFEATCQILRRQGICSAAWVGVLDRGSEVVRFVAPEEGLPGATGIEFSLLGWGDSCHCARMALREGRPYLVEDVEVSRECAECRIRAQAVPHRSALAAPMLFQGRPFGVLLAYSDRRWRLGEEETQLLSDLAVDLALGMHTRETERALRSSSRRLRQLAQRVVSAQEEERLRVSRELHDEAGQALVVLKIGLEGLLGDVPPESRAPLREAIALADTTMERIRQLAHDLRPPALDTAGLNATLEDLCRDFSRRTRLPVGYRGTEVPNLGESVSVCFYRVLQEALTNVARHAQASRAQVTLARDERGVSLVVEDDGRGFKTDPHGHPPDEREGLGVLGMQERLSLAGGELRIRSTPGKGTRLIARVPWERVP